MSRKCWDDLDNHSLNDIRREYYEEVSSLAKEIVKDAKERDEDVSDVMHEWVDGHEWIIYTYKAKYVCMASRNDDAYEEHFGHLESQKVEDSAKAYCAMEQDIWEQDTYDRAVLKASERDT